MGVIIAFFGFMVTMLVGFQGYLGIANLTSWEMISSTRITYLDDFDVENDGSPFQESYAENLRYYCCESWRHTPLKVWKAKKCNNPQLRNDSPPRIKHES